MKTTFSIPSGCDKFEIEESENEVKIKFIKSEPEKYIPRDGDCIKCHLPNLGTSYMVYGGDKISKGDYINTYGVKRLVFKFTPFQFIAEFIDTAIKITPEELQAEFNKLGYEYNFETHIAEKMRWKPKDGEKYYYVHSNGKIFSSAWIGWDFDESLFKIGNCYKTKDEAKPRQKHYLAFKD